MNNLEEDLNIIELLKIALKFYADVDNYVVKPKTNSKAISLIGIDEGSQARFVLNQIKELEKINEKIKADYRKLTNDVEKESDSENIFNIIEKIKKIGDGN